MPTILNLFVLPALLSLIISATATFLVIKNAKTLGVLDNPQKRAHPATLHTKAVPRGGGIALFAAILITSLLFLPVDQRLIGILIGAGIIVLIGFLDDRRDVNPYWRLIGQFLAAAVVVASGIGIAFLSNPMGAGVIDLSHPQIQFDLFGTTRHLWILSAAFALVWIIGLANAVSWSSGVDGQLSGFVAIAAAVVAILSFHYSADITQWPITVLAAATLGAFLGFLPYHIYPQKIMPGFSGATLAGFMLAVLSILTTAKVGTLLLVLAIPVTDAGYIVIRRILSGKSPVKGDRGHLHHRLLDAGWSKQKIAFFYWGITGILGIAALRLNATEKFYTMIGIALLVGALIIWLTSRSLFSKLQDLDNG
ncbi:MAG: undecaprenyl/decaprenyl-phosphate alpha-N-acetylglucosaminyl 1-phosphate transferase [Candidatus Blackburnbacteria bacterium]|nr:undecaprenyl/decaprenyl-phosphate alpha-N-acetylglucosaminyl 1-phosphate transferase [Candidatus Blackburnbacteria bacterium]